MRAHLEALLPPLMEHAFRSAGLEPPLVQELPTELEEVLTSSAHRGGPHAHREGNLRPPLQHQGQGFAGASTGSCASVRRAALQRATHRNAGGARSGIVARVLLRALPSGEKRRIDEPRVVLSCADCIHAAFGSCERSFATGSPVSSSVSRLLGGPRDRLGGLRRGQLATAR